MSYTGRVLRIDLESGVARIEDLRSDWAALYLGARGLGVRYLLAEIPGGLDPLAPDNRLLFVTGPLTGTCAPCAGKLAVVTKSPATGTVLDCSVGGSLASALKWAGYDAVIVQGRAGRPVYVYIEDDKVEFRDAARLWGRGVHEVEDLLKEELGPEASVIAIGPAGENMVPFACLTSERYRQAGRGGAGAVMGSKRLKALVVRGRRGLVSRTAGELLARSRRLLKEAVLPGTKWAAEDGTPVLVSLCHVAGILPTRNFREGQFEGHSSLSSEAVRAARVRKRACTGCPVGCGNFIRIGALTLEGPEYETVALCGSNCGISDLGAVAEFNRQCDDLGLDTISTGNVVALAMDMTERGVRDFGLRFGDVRAYLDMPRKIAHREGVGAELALGARELGRRYGASDLVLEVKGLEMPGYEPRGSWGMGLAYATSDRGACHMRAFTVGREALGDLDPFTVEGKAAITKDKQDYNAVKWSLPICDFWAASYEDMAELLSADLGQTYSAQDLRVIGERIYNLSRLFNVREGFRRDELPRRLFREPLAGSGPAAGRVIPRDQFEAMLSEYYRLRGWDEDGIPERSRLEEIGIDDGVLKACGYR